MNESMLIVKKDEEEEHFIINDATIHNNSKRYYNNNNNNINNGEGKTRKNFNNNNKKEVKALISEEGGSGITSLLYACQQGHVHIVEGIVRNKPSQVSFDKDRRGRSGLHYCCISDNVASSRAADLLVMTAPDLVDKKDDEGFTPLHLAVIAGNLPLVNFLLANGADVNATDNEKHSLVHWAAVCGETSALRAVLEAGAPTSTPDIHGGYPLHYAAQMCGDDKNSNLGLQVLNILLSDGKVDVTVEDNEKRQPLIWAASAGSAKAVLSLTRAGASVESPDKDGLTALHCAASRGHTECLETLLTLCAADVNCIDNNGCTALHYSVTLGHADSTMLLLNNGADPNRQERKGRTAAHCGCAKGQFETVKMLAKHGANLWLKNVRGDYPLHEAAASGRRELVKWFVDSKPSHVDAKNNDGRTPLHIAAINDNVDICKILLDAGADVNAILRNSRNALMTPLDCALKRGFRTTAKFLQLHGGLPAKKMFNKKKHQKNTSWPNLSSGISLQIRDDITFVSNSSSSTSTSSSSKEEKVGMKKKKRKTLKRKTACKYSYRRMNDKSKSSISDGDDIKYELNDDDNDLRQTAEAKKKHNEKRSDNKEEKDESVTIRRKSEILIYANQVNINDKNGEIILKGQRPKSAKFQREKRMSDQFQVEEEIEKSSELRKEEKDVVVDGNKKDEKDSPRSFMSNTSEEEAQQKLLLLTTASIHSPPKGIKNEEEKEKESDVIRISNESETDLQEQEEKEKESEVIRISNENKTDLEEQEEKGNFQQEDQTDVINTFSDEKTVEEPKEINNNDEEIKETEIPFSHQEGAKKQDGGELVKEEEEEEKESVLNKEEKVKTEGRRRAILQRSKSQMGSFPKNSTESETENVNNFKSTSESYDDINAHRSFKILDTKYSEERRSRSEEKLCKSGNKKSRIPTRKIESRIPYLPEINKESENRRRYRSISNMSAPVVLYSDRESVSDYDAETERRVTSSSKKKRLVRKKAKSKGKSTRSEGSDYDSSNLIDSGFEPSPRSSRVVQKPKNISNRGVNMTSVTQAIQTNIRRYHLERKIFQHLLELKRIQIRSDQHNENVLVKRAIETFNQSCASTVGAGKYTSNDYTFKSFEKFLYDSLRKIQKSSCGYEDNSFYMRGLPETNPLHCTRSTYRCDHAIHAYTGIPCAAYLPKMNHHTIPKIGFDSKPRRRREGTVGYFNENFLPKISSKNGVTLELCHGTDKQIISLPAERLDQNKRYYVTFTVKGHNLEKKNLMNDVVNQNEKNNASETDDRSRVHFHQHSKSI